MSREIDGHVTTHGRRQRTAPQNSIALLQRDAMAISSCAAKARHGELAAAGDQHAGRTVQPAVFQLDGQKPAALERARHDEMLCLGGKKSRNARNRGASPTKRMAP